MNDNNNNTIDDKLENKRYAAELENDRKKWVVRRRIAVTSFINLIFLTMFYSFVGLVLSKEQAEVLTSFSGIIITIVGAFVTIVLTYFGTAYMDDKNKMGK